MPAAALAQADNKRSDWEIAEDERNFKEGEVTLPASSKPGKLLEFEVSSLATFRFFIDSDSLSLGKDGVVRYMLVARSPSGVDNVTYEGIRCGSGLYKVYATGRSDGKWIPRTMEWQEIPLRTVQRWHLVLRRSYFCPQTVTIRDVAEGLDALKRGGHPNRGFTDSAGTAGTSR